MFQKKKPLRKPDKKTTAGGKIEDINTEKIEKLKIKRRGKK